MTSNFETVNRHVEHVDLKTLQAHDRATAQANLCGIWAASKPVIMYLAAFPFFPARWTAVLKQFAATLDLICPPGP